jgi:hypothetical protein
MSKDTEDSFTFLIDPKNWNHMGFLRADLSNNSINDPVDAMTKLSATKFRTYFD